MEKWCYLAKKGSSRKDRQTSKESKPKGIEQPLDINLKPLILKNNP